MSAQTNRRDMDRSEESEQSAANVNPIVHNSNVGDGLLHLEIDDTPLENRFLFPQTTLEHIEANDAWASMIENRSSATVQLARMLSINSVVSTHSDFAMRQQAAQESAIVEFKEIGKGVCGTVYENPREVLVYKMANGDREKLWNDFRMHTAIQEAFLYGKRRASCFLPMVVGYVTMQESWEWFEEREDKFPPGVRLSSVLISKRILPLPEKIAKGLIDKFCPEPQRAAARLRIGYRPCIARVYLGKRERISQSGRPSLNTFSLYNFNMTLDKLEVLGQDPTEYAVAMAEALAIMHWSALVDAEDVEFVLGSTASDGPSPLAPVSSRELAQMPSERSTLSKNVKNFHRRTTRLWLLDFDRCHKMTPDTQGVAQAVGKFFKNDPYYPRPVDNAGPDRRLWERFAAEYVKTGNEIMADKGGDTAGLQLPTRFISAVVNEQRRRNAVLHEEELRT